MKLGMNGSSVENRWLFVNIFLNRFRKWFIRILVYVSALILGADFIYKIYNNIDYFNKEKCILYKSLPRAGFLIYEYFVELFLIVLLGIFISVLLESYFIKYKKFYPSNPITAFLYASVIPVCSCSVLPLTLSMRDKMQFRTIMTFVVAAPLLNPYIVVLSFTVLGVQYGLLRIAASFLIAISTGYILEKFSGHFNAEQNSGFEGCASKKCYFESDDPYDKTFNILKQIFPYLILAGVFGLLTELYLPVEQFKNSILNNDFIGSGLAILIGIPVYFCNGADVLFLRPLLNCDGLSMGAAVAFSLTSTAVCTTSFIMLLKFIGKKLTFLLLANVMLLTFIISILINIFI